MSVLKYSNKVFLFQHLNISMKYDVELCRGLRINTNVNIFFSSVVLKRLTSQRFDQYALIVFGFSEDNQSVKKLIGKFLIVFLERPQM